MSVRVIVTAEHLKRMKACQSDRRRFKQIFGEKASLTKGNLRKAASAGLSVGWFLAEAGIGIWIGWRGFRCPCRAVCCGSTAAIRATVAHNVRQVDSAWPEIQEALPGIKERLAKVLREASK